jgi:hypothetical protein
MSAVTGGVGSRPAAAANSELRYPRSVCSCIRAACFVAEVESFALDEVADAWTAQGRGGKAIVRL